MNDFGTIVAGVAIGNALSILAATYVNGLLDKREAKKRKEEFDKLLDKISFENDLEVKPLKKAAKKATPKKNG